MSKDSKPLSDEAKKNLAKLPLTGGVIGYDPPKHISEAIDRQNQPSTLGEILNILVPITTEDKHYEAESKLGIRIGISQKLLEWRKTSLLSVLPEKKTYNPKEYEESADWYSGYNTAIEDFKSLIEGLE